MHLYKKKVLLLLMLLLLLLFSVGSIFYIYNSWFSKNYMNKNCYSVRDYVNIAKYFEDNNDDQKALEFYEKAVKISPNDTSANRGLAKVYFNLGEYQNSIKHFKKLSILQPNNISCLFEMGCIFYHRLGDLQNAVAVTEKYISYNRHTMNNFNAHIVLQDSYFKLGNFKKALEHGKKLEDIWISRGISTYVHKEWDGVSNLQGKTVLLRDNVGIGDIFCWVRYAKNLKDQGAKVILETRKFLISILSKCPYLDDFVAKGSKLPEFDYQVLVGKLPFYFVTKEDDLKMDTPYMYADSNLVNLWEKRLSKNENLSGDKSFKKNKNFKIGICWDPCQYKNKAGEIMENKRAIPLCLLYPFSQLDNITLYSLQQTNGTEQLQDVPKYFKIKIFDKNFDKTHGSFSDTAAVMKNLDLVITVDTSVAHLAGALGVQVWMLLPLVSDWRWLSDESKTVLYPMMRLFRQKKLNDWESVVNNVCCELQKIIN